MFQLDLAHREPAECRVTVQGAEISDLYPYLIQVEVDSARSEAATATLKFESRRDSDGSWVVQDDDRIAQWNTLRIDAVFGSESEEVFRGYIREIKAEYPEEPGTSAVTVSCQDESMRLDREHHRQSWPEGDGTTTDADIFSELMGRYGFDTDPECGSGLSGIHENQDGTDIQFLRQRAEANGYELMFREGQVYFGPVRFDSESQSPILVYAGTDTNCLQFSASVKGDQPDTVIFDYAPTEGADAQSESVTSDLKRLGRDPVAQETGLEAHAWRMTRQGGADLNTLRAQAQRKANELSLKVKAEGELDGSLYGHVLQVGGVVPVDGVGDRYGGKYYVDTVTHTFDSEGYREHFTLIRNGLGDDYEPSPDPLKAVRA